MHAPCWHKSNFIRKKQHSSSAVLADAVEIDHKKKKACFKAMQCTEYQRTALILGMLHLWCKKYTYIEAYV